MPNGRLAASILTFTVILLQPCLADPLDASRLTQETVIESPSPSATTFSDWTLGCGMDLCAIYTSVDAEDGENLFRVTLKATEVPELVFSTTLPLYLPDGLKLSVGADPEILLPWFTCTPDACEARRGFEPLLDAAFLAGASGQLTFTVVDGVKVRLRFSLIGYTDASKALADVSR